MTKRGVRVNKPCGWCGTVMVLKPAIAKDQIYCSKPCAMKARYVREGKPSRQKQVSCRGCHSQGIRNVRKHKDSGEFCSRECYTGLKVRLYQEKQALRCIAAHWYVKPPKAAPSRVQEEIASLRRMSTWAPGRTPTVRPCVKCGAKAKGLGNYSRMCTSCALLAKAQTRRKSRKGEAHKASKRICKARRRALERGVTAERIDPIKVFERDGWRCHMCQCKTPRDLRGTYHDRAPELDHVIPLAAGGAHTWGNVKCSCRKCNAIKSDKPLGQLGMDWAA